MAFDLKAPTFRHKMYDGYKATRHGMPDELAQQMPVLKELLTDLGYRQVTAEGWEADDILGTLAAACDARKDDCFLATGDRDSLQLVSETTTVLLATTALGRSKTVAMDVAAIEEKYGIQPRQLIEVKSLMGDASDNIPGVRGIGEKTALALVQRFGTLENVYANLDDKTIKPKQREHLLECRADAELSHLLGTIRTDAPIDTAEGAYKVGEGNKGAAVRLMQELELHTLIPRFGLDGVAPEAGPEEVPTLEATVSDLPETPAGHYLVATRPAVMGRAGVKNVVLQPEAWYAVQGSTVYPLNSGELVQLLDAPGVTLDVFDSAPLYALAMAHGGWGSSIVWDGKLAAYLLDASASKYQVTELLTSYRAKAAFTCEAWPDAGGLADLFAKMKAEITALGEDKLYNEIEFPLAQVLADMTRTGILVDRQGVEEFGLRMRTELSQVLARIQMETGSTNFNPNSPKQLGEMLFDTMGLPHGKKTQRGWSTDAETLEALRDYPLVEDILQYRAYQKLNSTYVEGLLKVMGEDDRVHTRFNQTEARTGRLSSDNPNLQNIPIRTEPGLFHRQARLGAGGRRLQPDRAAHPRPCHRRRTHAARLPLRRGHPPLHGGPDLQSAAGSGLAPHPLLGQGHQLRHHVRQGCLQPFQGHRRVGERGRRLPQELSGRFSQGERLYGQDHRRRAGLRLRLHPVRTPPRPAGADQHQPQHPGQRRADGPQHPHPRHRSGCHQAGHGAGLAAAAGRKNGKPSHPDRPR